VERRPLVIRAATPNEAPVLTGLAVRSKAVWGYSPAFIDACRDELAVDAERLGSDDYLCLVGVIDAMPVGYYTLERLADGEWELDALFVEPARIGTGIGRELFRHAVEQAGRSGATRLVIQSDPHAAAFYRSQGARQIGERVSGSIAGRKLPLFEMRADIRPASSPVPA
jgi:GNAT superfamily N-acetyltransferase